MSRAHASRAGWRCTAAGKDDTQQRRASRRWAPDGSRGAALGPSPSADPGGGGGESHASSSTGRSRRGRHQRAAQPHTYRPARPFFAPRSVRARASEREMGVTRRGHRGARSLAAPLLCTTRAPSEKERQQPRGGLHMPCVVGSWCSARPRRRVWEADEFYFFPSHNTGHGYPFVDAARSSAVGRSPHKCMPP